MRLLKFYELYDGDQTSWTEEQRLQRPGLPTPLNWVICSRCTCLQSCFFQATRVSRHYASLASSPCDELWFFRM